MFSLTTAAAAAIVLLVSGASLLVLVLMPVLVWLVQWQLLFPKRVALHLIGLASNWVRPIEGDR